MLCWTAVGCAAATYVSVSVVLLKWPRLLWGRQIDANHARLCGPCTHIAHRGGAGERLENTIAAFDHAVNDCHTDMLELDCQLTADGQVVVAHDDSLRRLCGVDTSIHSLTYKRLPQLCESLPLDFDRHRHYTVAGPSDDRRIPLLTEVFDRYPNTVINVDVKSDDARLMEKISDLIIEYKREHLTVWGNFRDSICQACYARNPNIPLLFSSRRVLLLLVYFYTGLLPFVPLREQCLETIMPSILLDHTHAVHQPTRLQRILVGLADRVLNNDTEFERAYATGVDGIMTDYPTQLDEFLV